MLWPLIIFFQNRNYKYINTPLITCSDCEGIGETFNVTTNYEDNFFDKNVHLTVSGQLNIEAYCCGIGDVYAFGPTFRAEKSHTSRHLAEFWMIEPEIAFANLSDIIECSESYIKFCIKTVLHECNVDLDFLDKLQNKGLIKKLQMLIDHDFVKMSYSQAIDLLHTHKKFKNIQWGDDFSSEMEKWLAKNDIVIIYDYPRNIKPFYMKDNDESPKNRKTVSAMDILIPSIGELVGGSVREENYDILKSKMIDFNIQIDKYQWYLDLRKYGTIPHGGFGLGFERLLLLITGMDNIKDVIPFPRTPAL